LLGELLLDRHNFTIMTRTGGGAYWAGRAATRPLFAPNGQAMMFTLPLFAILKFKKRAF